MVSEKDKLLELCEKSLKWIDNDQYKKRLAWEMKDIDAQNECEYFLDLYEKGTKFPENQHNLLVPYLLGIVKEVDINREPTTVFGDFPDIDVDYNPVVRPYIKDVWAPKEFGADKVCNIGSYNTFGVKGALQNMARVHNKSHSEIVAITKQLDDKITWEKALEYPELKKYCEENPDVAEASRRLLNRNNSMGKHAGGLIVSSVPIDNFIPLVKDKEGMPTSAWVEGLHGQDLGPMGLVKFDLLVITNLMQISKACKLVKERHGVESICALPGQSDWSDVTYLNDPEALAMANRGDLKCIFQFDSLGIRNLARDGGIDCFEDLVHLTAIFRPGPMQSGLHTIYINRKKGKEPYEIHLLLEPILCKTCGCLIYQESIMQILNQIGEIPLKDCEIVRKAISKKRIDLFQPYKDKFFKNGKKNLGWDDEKLEELWQQIEFHSGYSFNLSHAVAYTYISSRLLWLKAHYPLEFFAAILSCEDKFEKIREYKLEAEKHGIKVMPVDINISDVTFQIVGNTLDLSKDCIYYGLSNLKGVGEAVAEKIVAGQPYESFTDFLTRFGTDASVIKPLIGLEVFKEGSPLDMYKYYAWFKDIHKKEGDSKKRFEKRCVELHEELKVFLPPSLHKLAVFTPEALEEIKNIIENSWPYGECPDLDEYIQWQDEDGKEYYLYDDIEYIHKAYNRSVNNRNKKADMVLNVGDFKPEEIEIDEELVKIYSSQEEIEKAFYGFLWRHPLEKSPDYEGSMTFEDYRSEGLVVGPIECKILSVKRTESKNKKTIYWLLKVEDANSEEVLVQVWSDDWERFAEDLTEGALVKLKLKAPDAGFSRYTLDGPPRHRRYELPKSKSLDARVVVMRSSSNA